jgi:hypothetical protein
LLDSTVCFLTPLEIDASLKVNKNDKFFAPDADHQNIFQLTTAIVKKTQCSVNIVLCARVALMVRSSFLSMFIKDLNDVPAQGLSQAPRNQFLG